MDTETTNLRPQRGAEIVKTKGSKIREIVAGKFLVPSQSTSGSYLVDIEAESCTCPDADNGFHCKHRIALAYWRHEMELPDGNFVVTEKIKIKYPRNRAVETASQRVEKTRSLILLRDLVSGIEQPEYSGHGRPHLPIADKLFAASVRFLTNTSGKVVESALTDCKDKGLIEVVPHFNTVFNVLTKPSTTAILQSLITQSAAPFIPIETVFAVDSTGFSTDTYSAYRDYRWGKDRVRREFLKFHACFGVRTCIVTAGEVSNEGDAKLWEPLLARTAANGFTIKETLGDKGYLSYDNAVFAEKLGAEPFISPKVNSIPRAKQPPAYHKMIHGFLFHKDRAEKHYHQRSKAETGFSMIKTRFGGELASRKLRHTGETPYSTTRINEILLKALMHNVAVAVRAIHAMNLDPEFWPKKGEENGLDAHEEPAA
jgi:transposase